MRQASSDIWPPRSQFPFSKTPPPQNVPEGSKDLLLHRLGVEGAEVGRLLGRGEDVVEDAVPGQWEVSMVVT